MHIAPEFINAVGNRVVEVVVTRFLERPVALLDRKHAPRDHDDRRWSILTGKVIGKALRVDGGRGHDDFQVRTTRQDLAQIAEQKVDVQTALVRLVNDDGVVGLEQRIGLRLGQQNAVGHELDRGIATQAVLKAHLETDHITERRLEFLGDALGH